MSHSKEATVASPDRPSFFGRDDNPFGTLYGWRPMFVICGLGSLVVWYLRKSLPESPRWLETQGRTAEAEALMQAIEKEAATAAPLPPPQPATPIPPFSLSSLLTPSLLPSMVVGSVALIMINTLIFGFVQWLPTFFVQQGLSITKSFDYTLVIITGSPIGCRHRRVQLRLLRSQALTHCSGPSYDRTGSDLSVHARGKRPAHGWLPAARRDLRPGRDPVRSLHAGAVPD